MILIRHIVDRLVAKLDKNKIDDYEISDKIPNDVISIYPDQAGTKIFIPERLESSQYEIDDFLRITARFVRVNTTYDRRFYTMTLSGILKSDELYKIVKYIIEEQGFCTILTNYYE